MKLIPYTRNGPRESKILNKPCRCGATRTIPDPETKNKTIVVPKKYKQCCRKKNWPKFKKKEVVI